MRRIDEVPMTCRVIKHTLATTGATAVVAAALGE